MSSKIVNVYAEGEGYITFLLLKSLVGDGTLKVCFKFVDRLMFVPEQLNLMIIPKIQPSELEILRNHPHREKLVVISGNCQNLENCIQTKGEKPFFFEALVKIASVLKDEKLEELLNEIELTSPEEDEEFTKLVEKFKFYIPVLIGKRDSVIYGWKHFLGTAKVPTITHIYPRDGEVITKLFSNILIRDKIVPVPLGVLPGSLLEEIKMKGFVPYGVHINGKNNLDSEVKLINYGRKVAEKLKKEKN